MQQLEEGRWIEKKPQKNGSLVVMYSSVIYLKGGKKADGKALRVQKASAHRKEAK